MLKSLTLKIAAWRRYRDSVRELSRLSDRELADLGIARFDIRSVAECASREAAPRPTRDGIGIMAPAWGAHSRPPVMA